jgi:hypothetical protein
MIFSTLLSARDAVSYILVARSPQLFAARSSPARF